MEHHEEATEHYAPVTDNILKERAANKAWEQKCAKLTATNECMEEERAELLAVNNVWKQKYAKLTGCGLIISFLITFCVCSCIGIPGHESECLKNNGQYKISYDALKKEHEILTNDFSQIKVDYETLKMEYDALQSDLVQIKVQFDIMKKDASEFKNGHESATNEHSPPRNLMSKLLYWVVGQELQGPWTSLTAVGLAIICILRNPKSLTESHILVAVLLGLVGGCVLGDHWFSSQLLAGWLYTLLVWYGLLHLTSLPAKTASQAIFGELDSAKALSLWAAIWLVSVSVEVELARTGYWDDMVRATWVIDYFLMASVIVKSKAQNLRVPWSAFAGACVAHLALCLALCSA